MIGNHLGNLQQPPYPININININNSKKEGDLFQRNSANISTKGFAKRIYNINKGTFVLKGPALQVALFANY